MEGIIPTSQQSSHLTECNPPAGDVLSLNQNTLRNHPIVNYGTTVCYRCRDAEQGAPPYAKTVGNVMRQCDGSGNFSGAILECDGKLFLIIAPVHLKQKRIKCCFKNFLFDSGHPGVKL